MMNRRISRRSPMKAEPEDARLTGQTRNLERRLLALNVTRQANAIGGPTSYLVRASRGLHEHSARPEQSSELEPSTSQQYWAQEREPSPNRLENQILDSILERVALGKQLRSKK
jgi:hypothetical protein